MLTYEESNALMNDFAFRGRVKVSCLKFANAILDEPTTEPAHNTRLRWAQNCTQNPDGTATVTTPPTVMDAQVQQDGAAITDAALQGSVEATVKKNALMHVKVVSPFPIESLPRVWQWIQPFKHRVSDDFGPQNLSDFVDVMLQSGQTTWAVYGDSELGGLITFQRLNPWVGTGHFLFKPDFQGKGIGPRACQVAIAEMFATGIGRLVFYPLGNNEGMGDHTSALAIGSMLMKMGARREGCLRAQTLCGGKPTAMVIYGLLREEFEHAISSGGTDHSGGSGRGLGILGSWLSGRPKTTTTTTTPTWSPGMTDLSNRLQYYAQNQMDDTDPAFQQMKLSAQDQINRRYAQMPTQISRQMAARGYGSSGNFGNTMYQSQYQRSGEMSDLESQVMQMILNQKNKGASLSQQLLEMNKGTKQVSTGPPTGASNALLSGSNALGNLTQLLAMGNIFSGGAGGGYGGGGYGPTVPIPDVLGSAGINSSPAPIQYWPGTNIPRP